MPFAFARDSLFLIAGPCVLESDALNLRVAEHLARLAERVPGGIVFKASFDKANRSNADAARGPGLEEGLAALDRVRSMTGLPLLTDVHLPDQCAAAAEVVDVLQIPAFLCRQTDLLVAAGATGKPVNIKKGQWMHPEAMRGAVEKVRRARGARPDEALAAALAGSVSGSVSSDPTLRSPDSRSPVPDSRATVAVTERGTFFGYGDLVVDMRSFTRLRDACKAPVIFDATHSVQQPGLGADGSSGGQRAFIPPLLYAAAAAGADGFFLETHPDPARAPSDGPNMVPLDQLAGIVGLAIEVWHRVRGGETVRA
jgi:2-dehydro-3-deoxyphosphooctonate aldolase (KDO 8-P synthase)